MDIKINYDINIVLEEVKTLTKDMKDKIKQELIDGWSGCSILNKKGEYVGYWEKRI